MTLLMRFAVVVALFSTLQSSSSPPSRFQLVEATIDDVRTALASRQITCRALVEQYIKRIEAYDKSGPALNAIQTLNRRAVQDADRLDAIGAMGIARAFAYGGHRGRLLYDPDVPPTRHGSFAEYKRNSGPTINHFPSWLPWVSPPPAWAAPCSTNAPCPR